MEHERKPIDCGGAQLAARLGALSHPARLRILRQLAASQCCCKEVVEGLHLAQSTVSQHLKILVEAGLITMKQDRQRSIYEIDRVALAEVAESVSTLVASCCRDYQPGIRDPKGGDAQELIEHGPRRLARVERDGSQG